MKSRISALALAGALCLSLCLSGCGRTAASAQDLTVGISAAETATAYDSRSEIPREDAAAVADFGLSLLRACGGGEESALLSPVSILSALGMTANGAEGDTLSQMEAAFGLPVSELNAALSAVLPEEDSPLSGANAIWFNVREGLALKQDFLQTNADWYGAGVYGEVFGDNTCREINQWVSEHTKGMIPEIVDQVPEDALLYLVNALAFDCKWRDPFNPYAVNEGTFTREDGAAETVELMHGDEYAYLEGETVTGFVKDYQEGGYAFAALLPREGVTMAEAMDSLSGKNLVSILEDVSEEEVIIALPRFTTDYDAGLEEVLPALGMTDAFDPALADFTAMGSAADEGPKLYISRVLHKTHLEVDEAGTKAAAATAAEVQETAAAPETEPPKQVILDRPFLYLIVDTENNVPVFLGTVMSLDE